MIYVIGPMTKAMKLYSFAYDTSLNIFEFKSPLSTVISPHVKVNNIDNF